MHIFKCFIFLLSILSCGSNSSYQSSGSLISTEPEDSTILTRFKAPNNFIIDEYKTQSFADYLQNLSLKPINAEVKYYNGKIKTNYNTYCSVINMDIDAVDLQQCADAIMRLRGEYLFEQKRYSEIQFNFLSDGKPRYFTDFANGDYSYAKFRKYMKYIFSYANTGSLHDQLKVRSIEAMQIGDIFVQKKQPYGHAVIVVNMAKDTSGNQVYMLAQSYMPAQETQILLNPNSKNKSPWYALEAGEIKTPEWTFSSADLKHF